MKVRQGGAGGAGSRRSAVVTYQHGGGWQALCGRAGWELVGLAWDGAAAVVGALAVLGAGLVGGLAGLGLGLVALAVLVLGGVGVSALAAPVLAVGGALGLGLGLGLGWRAGGSPRDSRGRFCRR